VIPIGRFANRTMRTNHGRVGCDHQAWTVKRGRFGFDSGDDLAGFGPRHGLHRVGRRPPGSDRLLIKVGRHHSQMRGGNKRGQ